MFATIITSVDQFHPITNYKKNYGPRDTKYKSFYLTRKNFIFNNKNKRFLELMFIDIPTRNTGNRQ